MKQIYIDFMIKADCKLVYIVKFIDIKTKDGAF